MPATATAAYHLPEDEVTAVRKIEMPASPAPRRGPPPPRRDPVTRDPYADPYANPYADPYADASRYAAPGDHTSQTPHASAPHPGEPEPRFATGSVPPRQRASTPAPPAPAGPSQQDIVDALSLVRRFAIQADLAAATRILCQGIETVVGCDRVQCLTKDPLTGQPWAIAEADDSLAAVSARNARQVAAQPARSCPTYRPEVDDPLGRGDESLFAQPIMAGGGVIAVVLAVREAGSGLFGPRETALLMMLAEQCGPLLLHAVHTQAQRQAAAPQNGGLFRGQALENHRTSRRDGALLSLSPSWIRVVYPAVLVALVLAFGYGIFARVDQYSTGAAVIRFEGAEVSARTAGTVLRTYVIPGQQVKKGDLLVQLHSDAEDAELSEIEQKYEQQMATFLFDPSNDGARDALATIKARKLKADKILEARAIRAPRDGAVSDIRVSEGKRLEAGDRIMTIAEKGEMPTVIAFLPGGDRPRLKIGMTLQLKLPGFEKAHELATITEVGQEVIGPSEAKRFAGGSIADALPLKGSVVIVRAKLASRTFVARDKTYSFADNMNAKAEVSVKSRRVLVALVPALEKWL